MQVGGPVGHAVAAGAGGVATPAHTASVQRARSVDGERSNVAEDNVGAAECFCDVAGG